MNQNVAIKVVYCCVFYFYFLLLLQLITTNLALNNTTKAVSLLLVYELDLLQDVLLVKTLETAVVLTDKHRYLTLPCGYGYHRLIHLGFLTPSFTT